MKARDLTDVEECGYKIEALIKEYNCTIVVDKELKGAVILVDNDDSRFHVLPHINEFK